MKKYIGLLLVCISISACSPLQKALKSEDMEYKKEIAEQLFEQKKYRRAIRLYEQVETSYRARPDAEDMYYHFAQATFEVRDFQLAAHRFKLFASTYPHSSKHEEALLMEVKSLEKTLLPYSLDQGNTYIAISKLQEFIDLYPTSTFAIEANNMMGELNRRLEKKAFENAKQLNTIGEWTRDYNAAIVALDNFIYDYPGTDYKEDALFYKLDSAYKLAINSVYSKMEERLRSAKGMYEALVRFKDDTKYRKEADEMLEDINKELEKFS